MYRETWAGVILSYAEEDSRRGADPGSGNWRDCHVPKDEERAFAYDVENSFLCQGQLRELRLCICGRVYMWVISEESTKKTSPSNS